VKVRVWECVVCSERFERLRYYVDHLDDKQHWTADTLDDGEDEE
jgi:hypothetical protein